jgi:hypothetical protein
MRRLAALAGDSALFVPVHGRKSALFFAHAASLKACASESRRISGPRSNLRTATSRRTGVWSDRLCVSVRQRPKRLRQVLLVRQLGALNENWNHGDAALQCRFDLDPQVIPRIVEAPSATGSGIVPTRADDDEQGVAAPDCFAKMLAEVLAEGNRIDVLKTASRPNL